LAVLTPTNTIAVASDTPSMPQARCRCTRPVATNIVCAKKKSGQAEKRNAWRCRSGEPTNVAGASCSQYVGANPPNAINTNAADIHT
jgi:hypothetical protein